MFAEFKFGKAFSFARAKFETKFNKAVSFVRLKFEKFGTFWLAKFAFFWLKNSRLWVRISSLSKSRFFSARAISSLFCIWAF